MRPPGSLNKNPRPDYLENNKRILKAISGLSGARVTARQIQAIVPLSLAVINKHLRLLEAQGYIRREGSLGDNRGYVLRFPQPL